MRDGSEVVGMGCNAFFAIVIQIACRGIAPKAQKIALIIVSTNI
jgi:hypothetical protein